MVGVSEKMCHAEEFLEIAIIMEEDGEHAVFVQKPRNSGKQQRLGISMWHGRQSIMMRMFF